MVGAASDAWVRHIDRVVARGDLSSTLYNQVCTGTKALLAPANIGDATFTRAAVDLVLASQRIHSSDGGAKGRSSSSSSSSSSDDPPCSCKATRRTLGAHTAAEVRRTPRLLAKRQLFAGNWVILRRPRATSAPHRDPRYVTVVGFYDCCARRSGAPPVRIERFVKHMNLCRFARERSDSLMYMASGSFVVGTDGPRDAAPELLVNMRSGSWAMAKTFLYVAGLLDSAQSDEVDAQLAAFARPRVAAVARAALKGLPIPI